MRLSMLILGWACYYLPPGVSCCLRYPFMCSPGAHWSVSRSPEPFSQGYSTTVEDWAAALVKPQPWPCWRSIFVWSNKVTGSARHSSGSGRSGGEAVRWSRTNRADSGRVPQPSRLISNLLIDGRIKTTETTEGDSVFVEESTVSYSLSPAFVMGGAGVCQRYLCIFIWTCVKWTGQF